MMLMLSDSYEVEEDSPDLELKVRMININLGYNSRMMETCRTLDGYSRYVSNVCKAAKVRKHAKVMPLAKAVDKAVKECINKDIPADFLKRQRAEVIAVSIL